MTFPPYATLEVTAAAGGSKTML